jgi:hypothetical protein
MDRFLPIFQDMDLPDNSLFLWITLWKSNPISFHKEKLSVFRSQAYIRAMIRDVLQIYGGWAVIHIIHIPYC